MERRIDTKTSQLVDMALLTRAAFGTDAAIRFADIAGLPSGLVTQVLQRAPDQVRRNAPLAESVQPGSCGA